MVGWDPYYDGGFVEDHPAAVPRDQKVEAKVVSSVELGVKNMGRLGKEEIDLACAELLRRLDLERPWAKPHAEADLSWHTPTCTLAGWRHHDVKVEVGSGVAYVILNRPEQNNSMQDSLSAGLSDAVTGLHRRRDIRVAVFTGEGRMLCAGGDPKAWQSQAAAAQGGASSMQTDGTEGVRIPLLPPSPEALESHRGLYHRASVSDAPYPWGQVDLGRVIAAKSQNAMQLLPQFTICLANGSAMGGGVGLVCSMDYVIAVKKAYFVLSEVRIGVVPAIISPYVCKKLGTSNAKRFILCAENLTAKMAMEKGMVDEVVDNMKEAHKRCQEICETFSAMGPRAVENGKLLAIGTHNVALTEALQHYTVRLEEQMRNGEEYQEGAAACREGRDPSWLKEPIGFETWPSPGVGKGERRSS